MSAFGLLPFGTEAPWGGPGLLSLITILCVGENELIAFFTLAPRCDDPLGYRDGRNTAMWTIEPVDPVAIGLEGEEIVERGKRRPSYGPWIAEIFVDPDDATQIHLVTVPRLEPGVKYDVTLAGAIRGAKCEEFGGLATFRVLARNRPEPKPGARFAAQDTYRDWANPYFTTDPATGQLVEGPGFWQLDETGEIVLDTAAESLKKRVIRRLETELGGFAHLPTYGTRSLSKALARSADVQEVALRLQEQLRQEPDVRGASVAAQIEATPGGGIVRFQIKVQPRGIAEVSFLVQVPAGGV